MPQFRAGIESEKVLDGGDGRAHGARMAITILSPVERDRMRRAGRAAAATLAYVGARLVPGMTTEEIDRLVRAHTEAQGGRPSQLGYHGFPAAVCVSRNDIVCHGVPSPHVRLVDGDIVNVDVTTELDGYHGDTSATFVIGDAAPHARALVELARGARDAGIAAAVPGARLGDIGAAITKSRRRRRQHCRGLRRPRHRPRDAHGSARRARRTSAAPDIACARAWRSPSSR